MLSWHGSTGFLKYTIWKAFPDTILRSSVAQIQAKFENDSFSRNGHKIKITQPNLMILVSLSSAEDALFNYVKKKKKYDTFSSQSTENQPFPLF